MATAARVKTWISNETLTASDLNAEFNGVINFLNASAQQNPAIADLDMDGNAVIFDADGDLDLVESSDDILALRVGGTSLVTWDLSTASAVNGLTITPSAAGSAVGLDTFGTDTDVSLAVTLKGAGVMTLDNLTASTALVASASKGVTSSATTSAELAALNGLTASKALATDGSGLVAASATTSSELAALNGLTLSRALVTDASGLVSVSATTSSEIAALNGLTISRALASDGSGLVSVSATTATELGYLSGVSSALQTQIDGKAASSHSHAASDVTSGTFADARISASSVTQHVTLFKSATVENPSASEDIVLFYTSVAITITAIEVVVSGSTPSLTVDPEHTTDISAAGNDICAAARTVTNATNGDSLTLGGDTTIPASSFVKLITTAQSGTVDYVHLTFFYTED